jgi:phage baseplate assembly protein V
MSFVEAAPRESAVEAGGYAKGVAVATVADNNDPDNMGRVKVKYPWFSNSSQSYWAPIAVPMAGNDRGVYFLPEVNDQVLVAFERGDLSHPYVVGAVWNGKDAPPSKNTGGKNDVRMIKSRKGHVLTFDDGSKGVVSIQLNDGKIIVIDDDRIKIDDNNNNTITITAQSGEISISASGTLKLSGASISLQSQGDLQLNATGNLTISGTMVNIN